ncbi:MAG: carboxylesterase/lipase family protein [Promethearchaeota archaeon]|jgi:para-nitrobenzyl esterase
MKNQAKSSEGTTKKEMLGRFEGIPIEGLSYKTPTLSGITDIKGQFRYIAGESLVFSIGKLILGETVGKETISLIDIVPGAENSNDQRVINLCILIQTLNEKSNINNGIRISGNIATIVSEYSGQLNFNQPSKAFRSDPVLKVLIEKLNSEKLFPDTGNFGMRPIRNASAAQASFEASLDPNCLESNCHKIVEISSGRINGYATSNNTYTWLGVPYAEPPIGDLRWKPPQKVTPWEGIRDCTQWGDQCGQGALGPASHGNLSEDCLNLNIVAPKNTDNKKLPVMVWFHGGGFHAMSANNFTYNYTALPAKGVIIVSVNHRLGPLGYMAHPALSAESENGVSGNYGQLDLILALKWVKENISVFGGDADCVTIFGESGGGGKTFNLIISPLTKGLFHRAIIQSGVFSIGQPHALLLNKAEARGESLVEKLGIKDGKEILKKMREKSWQDIVKASQEINFNDIRLITIDNWYLLDDATSVFDKKLHNDIPIIIGANRTDMTYGMIEGVKDWAILISKNSQSNIFTYLFGHVPTRWRNEGVVAFHGLEIPYVFGCFRVGLKTPTILNLSRTGGAKQPDPGIDELDDQISNKMMDMWAQFAKTGDPNIQEKIDEKTTWTPYDSAKDNFLLISDDEVTLRMETGITEHYEPPPKGIPPLIPVR